MGTVLTSIHEILLSVKPRLIISVMRPSLLRDALRCSEDTVFQIYKGEVRYSFEEEAFKDL